MSSNLFSEFSKVSSKEWKQKIQVDLKGADYQKLITQTPEKIDIKPFYHYDDYIAFKQLSPTAFQIVQELHIHDETTAGKIARKALDKGADFFTFHYKQNFDIDRLIQNSDYKKFIFKAQKTDVDFIKKLYDKTEGKAQILIDPIGDFARYGNWYENENKDFEKIQQLQAYFPANYRFIEIRTQYYKNAGATITQEIAYALNQAVEYIEKTGIQTVKQLQFSFAAGSRYFFEIAKIKTFRSLWQLIVNQYNINDEAIIYSMPALRNKTIFDPYVNMLRTTMEMMSAILGGSNFIANMPYDYVYNKSNEFSERIARNQLIILKEEAGFEQALHVTENNYFLEEIAYRIGEKSLEIFKQIENSGGFLSQLYKGKIQQKIEESHQKEQADFDNGKIILVGTNKYINENEKPEKINIYPFLKKRSGKTLIRPVIPKRLAEKAEQKRLSVMGINL
jgi:methylmalonyl-CoA mutase